jgi:hypothetical protein
MYAFIAFVAFPFFFFWLLGSRLAGWLGVLFVVTLVILGVGFVTGLLFTWFIEPQSYWHAYQMPELSTNIYANNLGLDDPMYKMLAIPYIVLFDAAKIYVSLSLGHGTLELWIPEFVSFFILRNLYVISRRVSSGLRVEAGN